MFIKSKRTAERRRAEVKRLFSEKALKDRVGSVLLAVTCSTTFCAVAAAEGDSGELAPKIPETANAELTFSSSDLAAVIAIDEQGNYKIFRSRNASEDAKNTKFPIPAKEVTYLETFTVFKINPTCIVVGGTLICW